MANIDERTLTITLSLLGILCTVNGQFKILDSSNQVSNSSSTVAFVQINHADPVGEQSRSFSIGDDSNLIRVHIQYRKQNSNHSPAVYQQVSNQQKSALRREMTNKKNSIKHNKYNTGMRRKIKIRPQFMSREDKGALGNPTHLALILQENRRILKKLNLRPDVKKRPSKIGTYKSSCSCIPAGRHCLKMQITIARCNSNEIMCCI